MLAFLKINHYNNIKKFEHTLAVFILLFLEPNDEADEV